jgi:hypothetical protein
MRGIAMDKLQKNLAGIVLMLLSDLFGNLKNLLMASLSYLLKQVLKEPIDFLTTSANIKRLHRSIAQDRLAKRPSGSGKTLLACVVSEEAQMLFFNISGSEFIELYVGSGVAKVFKIFEQVWNKLKEKTSNRLLLEYCSGRNRRAGAYPSEKRSADINRSSANRSRGNIRS